MTKPVYLHDLVTGEFHGISADKKPRMIGRGRNCDIVTSIKYTDISRLQAEVKYLPNRDLILIQRSVICPTYFGPEGGDEEQLVINKGRSIIPGYIIRFGDNYLFRVLSENHKDVQDRLELRGNETSVHRVQDFLSSLD
jgi:hypothetical protein